MEKIPRPSEQSTKIERVDAEIWQKTCWHISHDAQVLSEIAADAELLGAVDEGKKQKHYAEHLRKMISNLEQLAQSLP